MFSISILNVMKSIYSKNGHLAHNWYWTIDREMKNHEMNDIEIHVNSIIGS